MDMAKDPREMRKAIDAAVRMRFGDESEFPHSAALVHIADGAAYHLGWSGEDRMTAIAYMALKRIEELTELTIQQMNATPHPFVLHSSAKERA